jgi:hypothetical protein
MSSIFFPSVFSPNHSMLGSHLKHFLIVTLNSKTKESKLSSTNSNSIFIAYSALLATSTISFRRCIYECFSTSHNNPQNVRFYMADGKETSSKRIRASHHGQNVVDECFHDNIESDASSTACPHPADSFCRSSSAVVARLPSSNNELTTDDAKCDDRVQDDSSAIKSLFLDSIGSDGVMVCYVQFPLGDNKAGEHLAKLMDAVLEAASRERRMRQEGLGLEEEGKQAHSHGFTRVHHQFRELVARDCK